MCTPEFLLCETPSNIQKHYSNRLSAQLALCSRWLCTAVPEAPSGKRGLRAGAPRGLECGHTTSFGVSSNCFKSAPEKNTASRTKANSRVKLCTVNGSVFGAKISESEATRERKNLSEKAKCATMETRITIRVNA